MRELMDAQELTWMDLRDAMQAARANGKSIGLVPTMGALHVGHISLIEAALKKCDYVVEIFRKSIRTWSAKL